MTAYQQALHDIHEDLQQSDKCFISFRKDLNPTMRKIVNNYIKMQNSL